MASKFKARLPSSAFWGTTAGVVVAIATVAIAIAAVAQCIDDDSPSFQQIAAPTPQAPVLASADQGTSGPILSVRYLVANLSEDPPTWKDYAEAKPGDRLKFYVEMHNTKVGTTADAFRVRSDFPLGQFHSASSTVRFEAANASEVREEVGLTIEPRGHLEFVSGSTRLSWDPNGDGDKEYDNSPVSDDFTVGGSGVGDMHGCNEYIAQMTFFVDVKD